MIADKECQELKDNVIQIFRGILPLDTIVWDFDLNDDAKRKSFLIYANQKTSKYFLVFENPKMNALVFSKCSGYVYTKCNVRCIAFHGDAYLLFDTQNQTTDRIKDMLKTIDGDESISPENGGSCDICKSGCEFYVCGNCKHKLCTECYVVQLREKNDECRACGTPFGTPSIENATNVHVSDLALQHYTKNKNKFKSNQ